MSWQTLPSCNPATDFRIVIIIIHHCFFMCPAYTTRILTAVALQMHARELVIFTHACTFVGMWVLPSRGMESTSVGCSSTLPCALLQKSPRCCAALSSAPLTSLPQQLQTQLWMEYGTMMIQLPSWFCTNMARVCGQALPRHRSLAPFVLHRYDMSCLYKFA